MPGVVGFDEGEGMKLFAVRNERGKWWDHEQCKWNLDFGVWSAFTTESTCHIVINAHGGTVVEFVPASEVAALQESHDKWKDAATRYAEEVEILQGQLYRADRKARKEVSGE